MNDPLHANRPPDPWWWLGLPDQLWQTPDGALLHAVVTGWPAQRGAALTILTRELARLLAADAPGDGSCDGADAASAEMAIAAARPDQDPGTRLSWLVLVVAHVRESAAAPALVSALALDRPWVEDDVPYALSRIGAPALAPLRRAVEHDDAPLLARCRAALALSVVARDLGDRATTREVGAALERLLLRTVTPPRTLLRFVALALAQLGHREAVPAIDRLHASGALDDDVAVDMAMIHRIMNGYERLREPMPADRSPLDPWLEKTRS